MDKMVLKLVEKNNPQIDIDGYRQALLPLPFNEVLIDSIYSEILPSSKKHNSEILFTAVILLLFSPKTILVGFKCYDGIGEIIRKKLNLRYQQMSSYRIKSARDLYEVDKVFRQQVDTIVERSRV